MKIPAAKNDVRFYNGFNVPLLAKLRLMFYDIRKCPEVLEPHLRRGYAEGSTDPQHRIYAGNRHLAVISADGKCLLRCIPIFEPRSPR